LMHPCPGHRYRKQQRSSPKQKWQRQLYEFLYALFPLLIGDGRLEGFQSGSLSPLFTISLVIRAN
jgi:hypothetical protein